MTNVETIGVALAIFTLAAVIVKVTVAVSRLIRKTIHFLDDLNGEPARPGVPARPGLVEQVAAISAKQAQIEGGVSSTLSELTRNGGDSTKDAAYAAARAAERTERLMKRHLKNGEEIMEVGVHNDARLFEALRHHGIEVTGLRDYPPVDNGDDEGTDDDS